MGNILNFQYFSLKNIKTMTIRRILISLALMLLIVFTVVACSGTKNICPAYSTAGSEAPASTPNS
jgi:hypothetical protein